jgi:hypothetical protein
MPMITCPAFTDMNLEDLLNDYARRRNAGIFRAAQALPPMSGEEAREQIERLRRAKDDYLQSFVIHTEPLTGRIQWHMWSRVPDGSFGLGHGVHYHDRLRPPSRDIVAFIRGFEWRRPHATDPVRGYYLQPDEFTHVAIISDLKERIAALVAARQCHHYPETWITERISARGNC